MTNLSPWKIVRRTFLYLGIALIVLLVFGVFIVLTKGAQISAGWFGLIAYTFALFWVTISVSKERWHRPTFWLAVFGLLVVHSLAFVIILRSYPEWRMIWFLPIVILEAGLFSIILNFLFSHSPRMRE